MIDALEAIALGSAIAHRRVANALATAGGACLFTSRDLGDIYSIVVEGHRVDPFDLAHRHSDLRIALDALPTIDPDEPWGLYAVSKLREERADRELLPALVGAAERLRQGFDPALVRVELREFLAVTAAGDAIAH